MARKPLAPGRSLERRGPRRARRKKFLIYCEGITEKGYFQFLKSNLRGALLSIDCEADPGDPLQIVEAALTKKVAAEKAARRAGDPNEAYDYVWCVVDVDEHHRLPAALQLASRSGIEVAVSNPCFELWALLHFQGYTTYGTPHQVQKQLAVHMAGYEKSLECPLLAGKYNAARERAQLLEREHENSGSAPLSNPNTQIWRLVDAIIESAKRADTSWGQMIL